jgi:hypothetical protein
MTPDAGADDERDDMTLKPVVVRISEADLEAWRRITRRRYPRDTRRMSQVIRELIREEDARGGKTE